MTPPYLITASGQRYRLTGPELDTPRIGDIAHHLAQINRFTGAASRPYSVAEHSLLCEHIAASEGAGPTARLFALMHDAHEYVTADFSSPAKIACRMFGAEANGYDASCMSDYDEFERLHANHVRESFDLRYGFEIHCDNIRRWDLIALATERRDLMPPDDGEGWEIFRGVVPYGPPGVLNMCERDTIGWAAWRMLFLERYEFLVRLNEDSCCQNERRNMRGGCDSCGAPCL